MTTVKRISGDYKLNTIDGNIDVTTDTFTINGNLVLVGYSTNIESVDTLIYDNIITLVAGVSGAPTLDAGIEVDRGDEDTVSLKWYETDKKWKIDSGDGGGAKQIGSTHIVEDIDPHLGGNLNVNGFNITGNIGVNIVLAPNIDGNVEIDSAILIKQITSDPDPVNGYSMIYAKTADDGDTGLYVSNDHKVGEELITKRKAFVYSLIL
jgi:hypothetical protein